MGIVGEVMVENDKILNQKNISGLNFRISREIIGAGDKIAPIIFNSKRESIENTLIVSPPGAGKTTLLRDLTKIFSDGDKDISPCKVSLVDERSEIAGSYLGVPQKNVGIRTDVLDACPKAQGIILVIRSMSPDLVVTDEIGKDEDIKAINEAVNAGVKVLVSAHSDSLKSLMNRKGFRELLETGGIKNVILLSREKGPGTIEATISGKEFLNKNKI
ncbi:spore_III_AA: stage III sporulation protein AA [Natranaerofaba carboxydovora]|nr:spore_III_AA: stage III sporulation protein AA [Natranaerofaba carboxydovora]